MPIIEDARHPSKYRMLVGMVDVIFSDVAQPDQVCSSFAFSAFIVNDNARSDPSIRIADLSIILHVEIFWANMKLFLKFGSLLLSIRLKLLGLSTLWNVVRNLLFLKHIMNECYLLSCQVLLLTNSPAFQIMHMTMHSVPTWCEINTEFLMQCLAKSSFIKICSLILKIWTLLLLRSFSFSLSFLLNGAHFWSWVLLVLCYKRECRTSCFSRQIH